MRKGILFIILLSYPFIALAAIDQTGLLKSVTDKFFHSAVGWGHVILDAATWLFWTLGTISLTWTMGMLLLKQADLREFFAEFIRFSITFGFFLWLLRNGPAFAQSMIDSLIRVGAQASGYEITGPSAVMDVGFEIFRQTLKHSTLWHPITSLMGILLSILILIITALVAANMTVLFCAAWILLYAGVFFLGFGGSQWTSDLAINYYKAVLSVAVNMMTMILMIGVATSIINEYHKSMSAGVDFAEMGCILVVMTILLSLLEKVPPMVSGIITGSTLNGVGQFNAGTAVAASRVVYTMGRDALAAGVYNIAGGAQAMYAAYQQAQQHQSQHTGMFAQEQSRQPSQGFAAAMNRGMTLMADMGKNLAQGIGDVTKNHLTAAQGRFQDHVGDTLGGQITTAIHDRQLKEQSSTSSTSESNTKGSQENSKGSRGQSSDIHPEVQAFMDKGVADGG